MNTREIASKGRGGDTMLMHVTPNEVAGIDALARAKGLPPQRNPETGLPQAGFLDWLPTLVGLGVTAATGGAASPWLMGATVGGTTAATTGSLEKGLMAGLTAGGLSSLGGGLAKAGGAPQANPALATGAQDTLASSATPMSAEAGSELLSQATMQNPAQFGLEAGVSPEHASQYFTEAPVMEPLADQIPADRMALGDMTPETMSPEAYSNMSADQQAFIDASMTGPGEMGTSPETYSAMSADQQAAIDSAMTGPGEMGVDPNSMVNINQPDLSTYTGATATSPGPDTYFGTEDAPGRLQYQAQGLKNITSSGDAFNKFVSENQYGIGATGLGLAGSADIKTREGMEQKKADEEAEKEAERKAIEQRILANYSAVGRTPPSAIGGGPLFDNGGQVKAPQPQPPRLTPAEIAEEEKRRIKFILGNLKGSYKFAEGGIAGLTKGKGDGTSDSIPAQIDSQEPAALSTDEFVVPADVVSHIGNGSTNAGARQLYAMMDRIREARTGNDKQPRDINAGAYLPA